MVQNVPLFKLHLDPEGRSYVPYFITENHMISHRSNMLQARQVIYYSFNPEMLLHFCCHLYHTLIMTEVKYDGVFCFLFF